MTTYHSTHPAGAIATVFTGTLAQPHRFAVWEHRTAGDLRRTVEACGGDPAEVDDAGRWFVVGWLNNRAMAERVAAAERACSGRRYEIHPARQSA
jgi:hypothetical protein